MYMPSQASKEPEGMEAASREQGAWEPNLRPKIKPIDRKQSVFLPLDLENLVGPEHKVRAIWELTGRLDLQPLRERIRSREGAAGQAAEDPQLLISLWIYAYSEGVSSSRELAGRLEHEPALMWLAGLKTMSHTTLSNFRKDHKEVLDGLFVQLLAMLETAGVVKLEQVMHDGTKIRAQAGADTFRRRGRCGRTWSRRRGWWSRWETLEQAQRVVEQMGDPDADVTVGQAAARKRAAREHTERLDHAWTELQQLQAKESSEEAKQQVRVSMTEPEARMMKHGDNAITPAYNAQTDAEKKVIVGAHLSQCSSDSGALLPALDVIEQNLGRVPQQVVVDGGFTTQNNIAVTAVQNRTGL